MHITEKQLKVKIVHSIRQIFIKTMWLSLCQWQCGKKGFMVHGLNKPLDISDSDHDGGNNQIYSPALN